MQGQLFTQDFVRHGIRETAPQQDAPAFGHDRSEHDILALLRVLAPSAPVH